MLPENVLSVRGCLCIFPRQDFESRLRAFSLFSVARRAKRETRKSRACTPLPKPEEKERLLAVYFESCYLIFSSNAHNP